MCDPMNRLYKMHVYGFQIGLTVFSRIDFFHTFDIIRIHTMVEFWSQDTLIFVCDLPFNGEIQIAIMVMTMRNKI